MRERPLNHLQQLNWPRMKQTERLKAMLADRYAALQRGDEDRMPGQPADCTSLFMVSVETDFDPYAKAGVISCQNVNVAAKNIVAGTHRIATASEIAAGEASDREQQARHEAADARSNNKRYIEVQPLTPSKGK